MATAGPSIAKYLEVLGISPDASLNEVKQAHRDLASVWHPDRFPDNPRLRDKATEELKEINVAYETLIKYHEAHGGFSAPADDAGEAPAYDGAETAERTPHQGENASPTSGDGEEPTGKSWLARHAVLISVLIAICLVGVIYMVQARKRVDFRGIPTHPTPYQATVVESGPAPGQAAKPAPPGKIPSAREGATQKPAPQGNQHFSLGSSREQVLAAQGPPQQAGESRWAYGSSYVDFTRGQVSGWLSSSLSPLHVRIDPARETGADSFTLGSSRDRVAAAQGTPTQVSKSRWTYGFSYVDFEKGKVKSWYSSSMDPLNVAMKPSQEPDGDYFTVGSTKDEVLAIQGTPTKLTETRWGYGYSYVDFERGRVARWYNSERDPLKVEKE